MNHAIALVPGFLGFDHHANTTYFADRFIAGLRASIEAKSNALVHVEPVSTLPIGSLADRQKALLEALEDLDVKLGNPYWHLVGHSTGGLDAAFLARTTSLASDPGGTIFSNQPLHVPRLRSVTTIATPHYGTCLTRAPLALMTHGGAWTFQGTKDFVRAAFDLTQRDALRSRLEFALGSALQGNSPHFLARLLFKDALARDLDPTVTTALTITENRRSDVRILSIATATPPPLPDHRDRLFRDLWTWTQDKDLDARPPAFPSLTNAKIITALQSGVPKRIAPETNDGVVNTDRQIDGTFAGLVLGDHGDVIGRYRREDLSDGKQIDPGLLTSGAEFKDNEFFALLGLVADGIARAIQETGIPEPS